MGDRSSQLLPACHFLDTAEEEVAVIADIPREFVSKVWACIEDVLLTSAIDAFREEINLDK